MEGFGEKSYVNLQKSIEKARVTTLQKLIYSLGIANIGLANAKVICKELNFDIEKMLHVTEAVSYTHLDVYKRQKLSYRLFIHSYDLL